MFTSLTEHSDYTVHTVVLIPILLSLYITGCEGTDDAKRLHDDLLRGNNYNKLIRPGPGPDDKSINYTLPVKMGLKLAQIIDVDERNEIITMNMWVVQQWKDYKLSWDPAEYGHVRVLYVPSDSIWVPDLVLYNNADGDYTVTLMTKARVYNTGKVYWEPPAIYKSQCNINVDFFPFDEQDCHMKFGCWTYDGSLIDLTHIEWDPNTDIETLIDPGIGLHQYYRNNEWDLMRVVAKKNKIYYTCCAEPYIDITFNITIRRKTLFYTVNLLIPIVSINMLTILAFYLPADCGEKISLCISILLSLSLFQLLLMELMPPTSLTMPLLGKYILFTTAVVTLSVFSSVIVLNVHFRSTATHKMPYCTRKLFLNILPRLLFMYRPEDSDKKLEGSDVDWSCHQSDLANYVNPYKKKFKPIYREHSEDNLAGSSNTLQGTTFIGFNPSSVDLSSFCEACSARTMSRYPPNAIKAMDGATFIAKHMSDDDESRRMKCEWKYVGLVIDRLLLWIYFSVCVVGAMGILLNAPVLYNYSDQPMCYEDENKEWTCIPREQKN